MLTPGPILLDACVLINLFATDRIADLLSPVAPTCWIATAVAAESIYLRPEAGGKPLKISLDAFSSLLPRAEPVSETEISRYVFFASELDDGEAMSLALAEARGWALATDDRKARRLASARAPGVSVFSTAEIVHAWAQAKSDREIKQVLTRIQTRASFRPSLNDPLFTWWATILRVAP